MMSKGPSYPGSLINTMFQQALITGLVGVKLRTSVQDIKSKNASYEQLITQINMLANQVHECHLSGKAVQAVEGVRRREQAGSETIGCPSRCNGKTDSSDSSTQALPKKEHELDNPILPEPFLAPSPPSPSTPQRTIQSEKEVNSPDTSQE